MIEVSLSEAGDGHGYARDFGMISLVDDRCFCSLKTKDTAILDCGLLLWALKLCGFRIWLDGQGNGGFL